MKAETGTVAAALAQGEFLLETRPDKAAQQAREILKSVPDHPQGRLLLAAALRRLDDAAGARVLLEELSRAQAQAPMVWLELGLVLGALGDGPAAIAALKRAVQLKPDFGKAWAALAQQHAMAGDDEAAARANARQIAAATKDPALVAAATALAENKLAVAEHTLRDVLRREPDNIAALRLLAETGARLGRYGEAETLLAHCLELAPGFTAARHNYATVLHRQSKSLEAIAQTDRLLAQEPGNPVYRTLRGAALGQIGEYGQAIAAYEDVLKTHARQPRAWMSYGHALKATGRQEDGIAAYRKAILLAPQLGEAWWSLANLKTVQFGAQDIAQMRRLLTGTLSDEDRYHLDFALGKALEDAGDYAAAFSHYAAGNGLRRKTVSYSADETAEHVRRSIALFTPEFFAGRAGQGDPASDPIFIVGLPRSGSTLVEQILATHSQVEGTMELPDIAAIARRLSGRKRRSEPTDYPEVLARLGADQLKVLGAEYLDRTRIQRKLGRPLFIDKMPNNWAHAGLIHLVLPNAKIIDARRHPLGCCFSAFKQHFARGQGFSYDLTDLGRYYADYVALMTHMDAVLPGRIHRVQYEEMVADPEVQVRRLLAYCGLDFEERCLFFYQNDRAVRTASSEQVRRPIFKDGVDQWRNFEPWLEPLKEALGAALPKSLP
jgi:predicted Zn-dependent protease